MQDGESAMRRTRSGQAHADVAQATPVEDRMPGHPGKVQQIRRSRTHRGIMDFDH
jgi:hypothetical protein